MPYDPDSGTGSFFPEGSETEFTYEIENWYREGSDTKHTSEMDMSDMAEADRATVAVWPTDDPEDVYYDTIWGPFDGYDNVEGFLEYDFGNEGSIEVT